MLTECRSEMTNEISEVDDGNCAEVEQLVELFRLGCRLGAGLNDLRRRPGSGLQEVQNLHLDPCVDLLDPYVVV